ncbi:MAG: hypothetical protein PHU21_14870, partial [Elusimicrobia bacterium]|nr:hypothetical protein [Elusimicrobiota bacterium]
GGRLLGYVHGITEKARFGGMQLVISTDPGGVITGFYYQRLLSPEAKKLRDPSFTRRFIGLTLADFYRGEPQKRIHDPTGHSRAEFQSTLRGLLKNLVLLDAFKLDNKYDAVYRRIKGK